MEENKKESSFGYLQFRFGNSESINIPSKSLEYLRVAVEERDFEVEANGNQNIVKTCEFIHAVINGEADQLYPTCNGLSQCNVFERLKLNDITAIAFLDGEKSLMESMDVPWDEDSDKANHYQSTKIIEDGGLVVHIHVKSSRKSKEAKGKRRIRNLAYFEGNLHRGVVIPKEDTGLDMSLLIQSDEYMDFSTSGYTITPYDLGQDCPYTFGEDRWITYLGAYSKYQHNAHEELVALNYKAILEYWEGKISDEEFCKQFLYIKYDQYSRSRRLYIPSTPCCSQPTYSCNGYDKGITKKDFLDIKRKIEEETKIVGSDKDPYPLIQRYLDYYKNHLEGNYNLLGLYLSYFVQRMKSFDSLLIHQFAMYLKTFQPHGSVEDFWTDYDAAFHGSASAIKRLAKNYWWDDEFNHDYEKCEHFALLSINDQDPDALLRYAVYLMDIRGDDPGFMRYSLKILLQTAISSGMNGDYLVVLQLIAILLCDRKLDMDCGALLEAMIAFLKASFLEENTNWGKERIREILSTIAGCYYVGNNVEKDISQTEELASMASPNQKANYYLGCIHHPNDPILNHNDTWLYDRERQDRYKNTRFCDCKNVYEYQDALSYFEEGYEKSVRLDLMEKWGLKSSNVNVEAQGQLNAFIQKWMKEKLN